MKQLIPHLALLATMCSSVSAAYEPTRKHWEEGDMAVQRIPDREYLQYSDEELSRLMPLIARWIPIREDLEGHSDQSWRSFKSEREWAPFVNSHPIGEKWMMGVQAASVLRALAENGRILDDKILETLIEGVAHPSVSFVGRDCFYALTALTKLYDDGHTSWAYVDGSSDPEKISKWFRNWYKANHGNQKIVTRELERRIKVEYLQKASQLERLVEDRSHGLHGFRSPGENDYHKVGYPLFDVMWDGRRSVSSVAGDVHGDGWVWLMVRTQSKLIDDILGWERKPRWEVLPEGAKKVYRRAIDGTDWAIEIYVNRLSDIEASALENALNGWVERGDVGQSATRSESDAEGVDKPQPESEGRSR